MPQSETVTQQDDGVVDDVDAAGAGGGADEPFLPVNDRTVYKTREDAVKGYNEAQKRITSLSEYEKVAKDFGITDPKTVRQLFQELVQTRKEKAEAAKKQTTTSADADEEALSDEDKKAIKWLEKRGVNAGLVSKKDFDTLKAELAELRQGSTQQSSEQFEAIVEDAQQKFTSLLTDAKHTLTDEQRAEAEEDIKAWINGNDDRVKQFNRGGAAMHAVIAKGFEKFVKPMIPVGAKAAANAKAVQNKTTLVRGAGKVLPREGGAGVTAEHAAVGPKSITRNPVHGKAWEMFQRLTKGDDGE